MRSQVTGITDMRIGPAAPCRPQERKGVVRLAETRFVIETDKSVDEAVQAVEDALAKRRFAVLWALNVNEKLGEKGQHLESPYRILEVCNAPRAKEALEANPAVGYFLPCKMVVYQADGRTEIGLPRPTALIGMVGDAALRGLAEDVEQVLVDAAREAAR